MEQRAALNVEFRGSVQHQRRQLRWTSRQFRRFYYSCLRQYRKLKSARQRFSEHLLHLIPYIRQLEAESLVAYDFFGGVVDHYYHQWVALKVVLEAARLERDRNFSRRGELASVSATLE